MRSDSMISTSDGDGGENSLESIVMMTHFPLLDEGEESRGISVLGNGLFGSLFGGFLRGHPPPALPPPVMQDEETQSASAEPTDQRQEDDVGAPNSTTNDGGDQTSPQGGDSRRLSKASLQVISSALKQGLTNGTRNEALVDYHKSEFKRYWMPDSTGKECYDCRERFTVFNRRHHCRLCGQIFCARCSNQHVDGTKLGYSGVLRLCALCVKQVDTYTSGRTLASEQVGLPMDLMEAEGAGTGGEGPADEDDIPPQPSPRPSERSLNTSQYSITSRTGEEFPDTNEENEWSGDGDGPAVEPRHRRAGSNQSEDHLHQPFKACIRRMLVNLLRREQLCDDKWSDFLLSLAYKLVEIIYPMVMRRTEALSPLDFVHIKKLILSNIDIPSHEIIRGPAFTKSLHHSAMPSSGKNVSIMLLGGNVSYERVTEKFTPVETVLLQEREYLKIQVERVTSRRVTLLLVENSVATSAADMLLEEGISLVTNVRRKVLELIARCVGADIITSLHGAQFLQPRIGFAPDFRQREFALVDGEKKFILTLDNCMGDGGISLLLKGRSRREVTAAKRVLRFLITAIFSSRLEISFLALFNSIPPVSNEEEEGERPTTSKCEVCHLNAAAQDISGQSPSPFVEALREVQLSNSPAISFSPPFLESEAGHSCYLVPYFKSNLFPLFHAQDFQRCAELSDEKRTRQADILEEYRGRRHENSRLRHAMLNDVPMDVKALMSVSNWAAYRSRSALLFRRRYEKNRAAHSEKANAMVVLDGEYQKPLGESEPSNPVTSPGDVLNPYNRQRIAFLYCANLRKPTTTTARSFCIGPYVLQRQFFSSRSKDTSLGAFLVGYCFNADYKCKGCDRSMMEHLRRIVHRHVRIEISTSVLLKSGAVGEDFTASEELPSAIPNTNWSSIICWRRCAMCLSNSSITSMPDSVYHLSFAKFIDYLGNGTHWTSAIPSSQESGGKCPHCTYHQHWHYFALRNSVTCFKVHPIRPLHVLLSPMCCRIISKELACMAILEIKYDLETMADEIFEKALAHVTDHHSGSDEVIEELRTFVDQYRTTFGSHLKKFDPDGVFKTSASIRSSDFYYIQSSCCLVRCRCFLHSFITKWNAKPAANAIPHTKSSIFSRRDASSGNLLLDNFLHTASSTAALLLNPSSREENSQHHSAFYLEGEAKPREHVTTENQSLAARPETVSPGMVDSQAKRVVAELPLLPNPLPRDMHYDLPMNPSTILVRDLLDTRGNILGPDIGSVIAYTLASSDYEEKKLSATITNGVKMNGAGEQSGEMEQSCEITFADARAHYCIRVYFPERFEQIRGITFGDGEEQFIRSLSRTSTWNPQGGKSGAVFYRTEDERFIIKQMSRLELESFKKCGLKYIEYVNVAANERKLSALCKIYGVYSVHYANKVTGSSMKMDVLIMEYLFYGKQVKQLWDLKGSLRNRYATTKTETPVLLDENLAQDLWRNQLYIHPHSKAALNKAIVNDSHFLCSQGIMDYSLLAGICHENDEVVIGIVDYMRTYTLDKKVESLVKTALPIAHSPTVVSPELYCKRFYDAIDNYFAMSPDQWTSSDPFFD